jgi:quercetin dioxygenase-like cupin family protein
MNMHNPQITGSQFRIGAKIPQDQVPWGHMRWVSHPASTGALQLATLDASIAPGQGHDFHKHPRQEEVLCVIEGRIEQWIDQEKRVLGPGDAVFIAPGTVHATFNIGDEDARVTAIFGPCVGDGFEMVDVSGEAPWRGLRV